MAAAMRSTAFSQGSSSDVSHPRPGPASSVNARRAGTRSSERRNPTSSRGKATPVPMRCTARSRSDTSANSTRMRWRRTSDACSQATASKRRSIASTSRSGWPTHRRSARAPIGVLVWSSTLNSDWPFAPQRPPSNSSRFRRVCGSSAMKASVEYVRMPVSSGSAAICVPPT